MPERLCFAITAAAGAREAKLVRSPHYHDGKVAFSYLGDIWTASEDGTDVVRLTANKARDLDSPVLARRQAGSRSRATATGASTST